MTANKNLKRRVRSRAAKTGESYVAALRHVRPAPQGETMPDVNVLRLATAQVVVREDPGDRGQVHQSGHDVRELMRQVRPGTRPVTFEVDGLRLGCALGIEVHFPEVFTEYERLDVDGVLFSTTGPGQPPQGAAAFATEAQAHAATNSL